jgi:hypothetical protein
MTPLRFVFRALYPLHPTNGEASMPYVKNTLRAAAVIAAAMLLSGCVVVPAGPGYYHPHRYYYW